MNNLTPNHDWHKPGQHGTKRGEPRKPEHLFHNIQPTPFSQEWFDRCDAAFVEALRKAHPHLEIPFVRKPYGVGE